MIIVFIIAFTVLAIFGFFFIKKPPLSWAVGVFFILLLILSVGGLVYHDNNHWGMKEVTTTTTTHIPVQMITAVEIGNTQNYAFSYKTKTSESKASTHFQPDESDIVNSIKISAVYQETNGSSDEVITKSTHYEWSNSFAQWLFGIGSEAGELVKETNTVRAPKGTILEINAGQAPRFEKDQAKLSAEVKAAQEAEVKAVVAQAVAEATAGLPESDQPAAAQAAQAQAEATLAAQEKALQSDPLAAAKKQVQLIRRVMWGAKD